MSDCGGAAAAVPLAPGNLVSSASPSTDGSFTLSWNAPAGSGATPAGYLVYRSGSKSGYLSKTFADRTLSITGLEVGSYTYKVFACIGAETSPDCGPPASITVRVIATFEEPSLTGFDHEYKIWSKSGTNDFFVARNESAAGLPGVAGFYMKENKDADAVRYFNFEYPVTHDAARTDGFTLQPNLALVLSDVNSDGFVDLIIEGLENASSDRWNMILFAGSSTGSFPANRVEIDADFKKFFTELGQWYGSCDTSFGSCPYFINNADIVRVPSAAASVVGTGFAAKSSAESEIRRAKANDPNHSCNTELTWCFAIEADANSTTNRIASNSELTWVPDSTRYILRTLADLDDDPDLTNLFFVVAVTFNPDVLVDAKEFSKFGTAFHASFGLRQMLRSGELVFDTLEKTGLISFFSAVFNGVDIVNFPLTGVASDARARVRHDFLLQSVRRFAPAVTQPPDIVGSHALDEFVVTQLMDYRPFRRAGHNERAFSVDMVDGNLTKVREVIGSSDFSANPLVNVTDTVAIVHVHPESPIGISVPASNDPGLSVEDRAWAVEARQNVFNLRTANEDSMRKLLETECRELPGRDDHVVLVSHGIPNYFLTPDGAVRVLERVNGAFRVRTVSGTDYNGVSINSQTHNVYDSQGNSGIFNVPNQGSFVADVSYPCNPPR